MGNKPIVHAPIATGSTEPRDIRDRFADFLNVKDFGAVGDGIDYDTNAFNAAITAANGKPIFVPDGNYKLLTDLSGRFFSFGKPIVSGEGSTEIYDVLQDAVDTVYVDASHTNANTVYDGLTAATAFNSINQAINYISKKNNSGTIVIAGGTYTENIIIDNSNKLAFNLSGNITVNGYIAVRYNSVLVINGSSYTLTINTTGSYDPSNSGSWWPVNNQADNSPLTCQSNSHIIADCEIAINASSVFSCICAYAKSTIKLNKALSISTSNTRACILVCDACYFYAESTITISGSNNINGIVAGENSFSNFKNNVTITVNDRGIYVLRKAGISFYGGKVTVSTTVNPAIEVSDFSYAYSEHTEFDLTVNRASGNGSTVFAANRYSLIYINTNNKIFKMTGIHVANLVACAWSSIINFIGSGTISFNGSVTTTTGGSAVSTGHSILNLPSGATLSGTVTGKRYYATALGYVETGGKGANAIPGTVAGTADSSKFSFYN